jgi:hypothetical protein
VTVLVLLCFNVARARTFNVSGSVLDDADGSALAGALVVLIDASDSSRRHSRLADDEGRFAFTSVVAGNYRLRASFLGYGPVEQHVKVKADLQGIMLRLKAASTQLKAVEKVAVQPRVEQKGDTTIFNAGAYKVRPDATAEDLLKKMPGITTRNGSVKAQGEEVKRVLVDGTEFLGNSATAILKDLPADMIDKVQVFDKKSDQAEFTGFEDGNSAKTLNIVTKKGMDHGVFGDGGLGYGTDRRYEGSLSLNRFNGARRIGVMGQHDNTYQQGFSGQGQPGINTTDLVGLTYSDHIGKTVLSGNYYFYRQHGISISKHERTTFLSDTTVQVTNSDNRRTSANYTHDLSFRIETQFDSSNSLVITPEVEVQGNNSDNSQLSHVINEDSLQLSSTDNSGKSDQGGSGFSNSLLFRHRFTKQGRTFSADLNTSFSSRNSTATLLAKNNFLMDTAAIATSIDQRSAGDDLSQKHGLQLNYTEPVGQHGRLQFAVAPSIQLSNARKLTYDLDPDTGDELLNALLSNKADNTIRTLRGGVSYGYSDTAGTFTIGLDGQGTDMHSEQSYPFGLIVDRGYPNLLPNAMFSRNWSNGTRLNFSYRTSVNTPSITQLQTVVNNSDPLQLTTGNPGLDQSYQHSLSMRLNMQDSTRTRSFFALLDLQSQPGRISSVTFVPASDSTLVDGTLLPAGSQLTLPKNLDSYVSVRAYANYGCPITVLKSDLDLNAGSYIERLPGEVNGRKSLTWNTAWSAGAEIHSNFSESVEVSIGYTANYRTARSDLRPALNNSYYQGEATCETVLNGLKGWLLESEVNYGQYIGLGAAYDRDPLVWNGAVGHKFLRHDALEFRVSVYDILAQNVSVTRDVGDTYIQKSVANVLQRYVMFSLRFNLRAFQEPAAE